MASKSADFFEHGSSKQFEWVLGQYDKALQLKADSKSSKAETLLKLDKWYQNELPKKIKSRGKEAHLTHEELVQTIKWKLARGVFRPRLKDLVQMNTPRVVMQESKKAFRALWKRNDLESAVGALSNLKGVGPAMASAVLAAGAPEVAPFMADEVLLSMPEIEGIDYTMKEYMKLVDKTNKCVERLNAQGGNWTPHKVELAIWTHYVMREYKPELFDDMPGRGQSVRQEAVQQDETEERVNGTAEQEKQTITNGIESNGTIERPVNGNLAEESSGESSSGTPEPTQESNNGTPEPRQESNSATPEPAQESSNSTPVQESSSVPAPEQDSTPVPEQLAQETSSSTAEQPQENGVHHQEQKEEPQLMNGQPSNGPQMSQIPSAESVTAVAPTGAPVEDVQKEEESAPPAPAPAPASQVTPTSAQVHENGASEHQNGLKRPLEEENNDNAESLPETKRVREDELPVNPTIELSNKEAAIPQVNGVGPQQQQPALLAGGAE